MYIYNYWSIIEYIIEIEIIINFKVVENWIYNKSNHRVLTINNNALIN